MQLTTSVRFFRMIETLSPAEVLALAVRAGGTLAVPSAAASHTRESVPPAGAGSGDGVQGEPGTVGARRVPAHETGPPAP